MLTPSFILRSLALMPLLCGMHAGFLKATEPVADGARGPGRDVVSEDELRKTIQATQTFDNMMAARSKPVGEVRPSLESTLFTSSLILSDGEQFTLVPVGSILHLPVQFQSRVLTKPQGDFTFWPRFLKKNSVWLAAKEVPLEMAKGDAKVAKAVMRDLAPGGKVLVSVYKGGPISILEAAPESAEEAAVQREDRDEPAKNSSKNAAP